MLAEKNKHFYAYKGKGVTTVKPEESIEYLGIVDAANVYRNLPTSALVEYALKREEGTLANNGALVVTTGLRCGRSPNDRFVVDTPDSKDVWWGPVNKKLSQLLSDTNNDSQ